MVIYIDESGIFANLGASPVALSCVGALIVTEHALKPALRDFKRLKAKWGTKGREMKGSRLNEAQVAGLVSMLSQHDVIFTACMIDMGMHTTAQVDSHKARQADLLCKNLTEHHSKKLWDQLESLAERLRNLSNQLYVQAVCLTDIFEDVLQKSTLYYSIRQPKTLAQFQWILDRKASTITDYEDLWKNIVLPMLQTSSLQTPLIQVTEGNYKWFAKYDYPRGPPPQHLADHLPDGDAPFDSFDLKSVCRNIEFADSAATLGLQIVDALSSALRRACLLKLGKEGWYNLGKVMVNDLRSQQAIRLIRLGDGPEPNAKQYSNVVLTCTRKARAALQLDLNDT